MIEKPSYITIGCSHTNGTYLPSSDHWISMLSKRRNIDFFRISKNAAGLSFLVLYIKQYIKKGTVDPNAVKYVVIQKPKAYRHPFWGKDKSGYRYKNMETVKSGMNRAMSKWNRLSKKNKLMTAEIIFDEQTKLLGEIKDIFPQAHFAYYHYWGDHIAESINRPLLAEVNVRLGVEAEKLGMQNWKTIIDPKTIDGVYDHEGDVRMHRAKIFADGWIRTRKDTHPMRRHHEIVAEKVEEWLSEKL